MPKRALPALIHEEMSLTVSRVPMVVRRWPSLAFRKFVGNGIPVVSVAPDLEALATYWRLAGYLLGSAGRGEWLPGRN